MGLVDDAGLGTRRALMLVTDAVDGLTGTFYLTDREVYSDNPIVAAQDDSVAVVYERPAEGMVEMAWCHGDAATCGDPAAWTTVPISTAEASSPHIALHGPTALVSYLKADKLRLAVACEEGGQLQRFDVDLDPGTEATSLGAPPLTTDGTTVALAYLKMDGDRTEVRQATIGFAELCPP